MLNRVVLVGRLTADPTMRYTAEGRAITKFNLAVSRRFNRDKTDFIDVTAWGKLAELCAEYLVKGRLIAVDGRIETDSYTDREGIRRKSFEIAASDIKFLDSNKRAEPAGNNGDVNKNKDDDWSGLAKEVDSSRIDVRDPWDDDIPF